MKTPETVAAHRAPGGRALARAGLQPRRAGLCSALRQSSVSRKAAGARGEALVEIALIAPFVFFLVILVIGFAGLIAAWIEVANATRVAADYASLSGSSAGLPPQATSAALQNLINADLSNLARPLGGSAVANACVCQNNNGTSPTGSGCTAAGYTIIMQMGSSGCSIYTNPPSDGEDIASGSSTQYANLSVDITYTYKPFTTSSKFLGYSFPTIPTTVHQRAVMRVQ